MKRRKKPGSRQGNRGVGLPDLAEPGIYVDWTVTDAGQLIAVDEVKHRLAVEQADGSFRFVGRLGDADGSFHYPRGILVTGGECFVVDSWNHRVQVFDAYDWSFKRSFGSPGRLPGQFCCPSGIALVEPDSGDPWLAVADTDNNRLSFHAVDGRFLFVAELPDLGFPRRVRTRERAIETQCEDRTWKRLSY
jgi:hypothetical protein